MNIEKKFDFRGISNLDDENGSGSKSYLFRLGPGFNQNIWILPNPVPQPRY